MNDTPKYIIFIHANDFPSFVSNYDGVTPDVHDARVFYDRYDAQLYIEKHGLERMSSIRKIIERAKSLRS